MDEPRDYSFKWNKLERQIPTDTTYMWNLKMWKKWTYIRNRHIDIENKQLLKQERET